jgi:hypothetical protein
MQILGDAFDCAFPVTTGFNAPLNKFVNVIDYSMTTLKKCKTYFLVPSSFDVLKGHLSTGFHVESCAVHCANTVRVRCHRRGILENLPLSASFQVLRNIRIDISDSEL